MTRRTLKLTKPVVAGATLRPPTTRALRAMRDVGGRPAVPATTSGSSVVVRSDAKPSDAVPDSARRGRKRTRSGAAQRSARDANRLPAAPLEASKSSRRPHERRKGGGGPPTPTPAARAAPTPAPRSNSDDPRLSKRMSELGLCSRREADEWIRNGWVRVDGKVVDTLGTRVPPDAAISVDRAASRQQGEQVTILLHKPIGYVSGQAEDGYRPASVLIVPGNHWSGDNSGIPFKPQHLRGLAPAGRLDIDSTGLLVFTQDGRVAKHLIGHDSEVEKEYLVRVEGNPSKDALDRLSHGLELDGVKLKPAKVSWQNENQLRFVLREGRKRQIRRMCEWVGLAVVGLKRVRTGSVALGALPAGQWRYLRADETF
jgi:23S rRNA pseudouridine2604 synthase